VSEQLKQTIRESISEQAIRTQILANNNESIKSKILLEIEKVINYLEELKEGQHIDDMATDKHPDLFELSKHLINGCINQADRLRNFFKNIPIDSRDLGYLVSISISLNNIVKEYDKENYYLMPNDLAVSQASLRAIESFIVSFKNDTDNYNRVITDEIKNIILHAEDEVKRFRRIRNIADNAKTEDIYDQAVVKYRSLENDYRRYFFIAIGITVGLSLLGLFFKNWLVTNEYLGNIEFWVLKVSILAVGITLITYFLKQSAHYQRLAEQNYQTQVELQAYPSFMESIPTEEAASVRKELALKYFGREIDGAAHKDMSNLITD
jgi:hypothetical protein